MLLLFSGDAAGVGIQGTTTLTWQFAPGLLG